MDVVQSAVLHRKGKKWKSRWAVLRKNTAVADPFFASTINVFKDASHARNRQHKQILPLWKYSGCAKVDKLDKVENVLMIFIENTTIIFGFANSLLLNEWHEAIRSQFGQETTFPVFIPPKQKLKTGDGTLFIYNDFVSLINDKSLRCCSRWNTEDLYRYATIDGDCLFEVSRSRIPKGNTYVIGNSRTVRLKTKHSDDIVQLFDFIKNNHDSGAKLNTQFETGSSSILDMGRDRRNTIDSEQSFFQRALLRVSNRFRKHRRGRAETVSVQSNARREPEKEQNKASTSKENGSVNETDGISQSTSIMKVELPNEVVGKSSNDKVRSNSYGDFDSSRRSRVKAQNRSEFGNDSVSSAVSVSSRTATPKKSTSLSAVPVSRNKTSAGSVSGVSVGSRGFSTSSDVFDDDTLENKESRISNIVGPPVAPPRSPISLGIFEFPDDPSSVQIPDDDTDYLNEAGLDKFTRQKTPSASESNEVLYRNKAERSTLLDEIDREIKRRTREEDSVENGPETPLSVTSFDGSCQYDCYDNEEKEAYVMLRTTDKGPSVDVNGDNVDGKSLSLGQSVEAVVEHSNRDTPSSSVRNGFHKPGGNEESDFNLDPGVHSPHKFQISEPYAVYQNVSEIVPKVPDEPATKGRRNSSRRSSSKHLSDPLLTERLANLQQQWHADNVASSLRDLPHQDTNYVNVQGENNNDSQSSYVNVGAGGASERKLRKKKPSPLNFNFDKYDDDEKIYHDVGPLMGSERSSSSEAVGTYRNIGVGSYENLAGRTRPNRAYVNVPSPNHKKFVPMLNYVLVGGSKGGSVGSRGSRSGSLNSVNSDKSQYSMIDEKKTSLLQRTREQHWQRREEDGQAKLKKTKKSQGE